MNREELEALKEAASKKFDGLMEEVHKVQGEYRAYEHLLLNMPGGQEAQKALGVPAKTIEVTAEGTPSA